jgi:hypothetical protein
MSRSITRRVEKRCNKIGFFVSLAVAGLLSVEARAAEVDFLGDSGSLAGAGTEISIAGPHGGELLTALRESSGHLKVIRWSVVPDGTVSRGGSSLGNEVVSKTALSWGRMPFSGTTYWANVVIENGRRKVIAWKLSSGNPVRLDAAAGAPASSCDIATLGDTFSHSTAGDATHFVTLCENAGSMDLQVYSLSVQGYIGSDTPVALPSGTWPRIAYMGDDGNGLQRFITAHINSSGDLRVGLYRIDQSGQLFADDARVEGPASQVALGANPYGEAEAGARLMDGSFKMIHYSATSTNQLARGASATKGGARNAAIGYLYDGLWGSADRSDDDTLDVDVWNDGALDDQEGGTPMQGRVALATSYLGTDARMFAAFTDSAGNFELSVWRVGEPTTFNP